MCWISLDLILITYPHTYTCKQIHIYIHPYTYEHTYMDMHAYIHAHASW